MTAHILGAGASTQAGYPLASKLLEALSDWLVLDHGSDSEQWVRGCRNRIVQVRETFGSLDDFEGILGKLEEHGPIRVRPTSPTTYWQDDKDIIHDCINRASGLDCESPDTQAEGFYPQYLRSDLILALREFFYQIEQSRSGPTAYYSFAKQRIGSDSFFITLNYDVALERALAKAGKWDVGNGYGFTTFAERDPSPTTIYKVHGSVNWFQAPMQANHPPIMFSRDLKLLGYHDLTDSRLGGSGLAINNAGTLILPDPKKRFFWERFWSPLWSAAAERLRETYEVFIFGYSMPSADLNARELLFDNINRDATINVHCRSASNRIADEFRNHGLANVRPFAMIGFEAWAASTK
jgi:hypothetical protein